MFTALKDYFVLPFLKVSWKTIISIITFNKEEMHCNFTMKLPLILQLGWYPFVQKFWLTWYKFSDKVQKFVFGMFNPSETAKRILSNSFCPLPEVVLVEYHKHLTLLEARMERIRESLN
jgi:hypothetical protein